MESGTLTTGRAVLLFGIRTLILFVPQLVECNESSFRSNVGHGPPPQGKSHFLVFLVRVGQEEAEKEEEEENVLAVLSSKESASTMPRFLC